METKPPVETMETATDTTGSRSEGTRQRWGNFSFSRPPLPTVPCAFRNPPLPLLSSSVVTPETAPFRLVVLSPQGVPPTPWKTRRRQSHRSSSSPPPRGKRAAAGLIGAPAARPWPQDRGRGTRQHRQPPTPPAAPPSSCVITSRLDRRRPRLSWSS